MRKPIFCAMLLLLLCCLAASRAKAQVEYEYSVMWYDDTTVWGYSATEVDYYCAYDYSAYVESYLYSQYGLLDSRSDEGDSIAQVYTSASADPDTLYAVYGYHYVIARYYYEEIERQPEGCWPCDGCNTDCYYFYDDWYWYDPFGFTYSYPGYYGQWWYWYGYGPPVWVENTEYVYLGSTSDSDYTHGNPDHLQIMNDVTNLLGPCQGLQREITYRIVDVNNHSVGSQYLRENDSSAIDTCSGQVPSHSTSCFPRPGTFTDYLAAGCSEFYEDNCGFWIPDETWFWCSDGGLVPLARLDYTVNREYIIVSGYSGQLPHKWYVRADGSIQRR